MNEQIVLRMKVVFALEGIMFMCTNVHKKTELIVFNHVNNWK